MSVPDQKRSSVDDAGSAPGAPAEPRVVGVSRDDVHAFSKTCAESIELIEGLGVRGDAHSGVTVQHRSRVKRNPSAPNLRQVHLIHAELLEDLTAAGFPIDPGQLGENITTTNLDLLGLPVGARLRVGQAVITITGLRNPCAQIDDLQPGLLRRLVYRGDDGDLVRLAGVMGVVSRGGIVAPGDRILVELPAGDHQALAPV